MGDIGIPQKEVEFEPFPVETPVEEPVAPEPEKVPA